MSDVHQKLKRAYDNNRGCRLTADDVTTLVLMDSAILELTHPDREGGIPETPKARKPKSK